MVALLLAYLERTAARRCESKGRWKAAAAHYAALRRGGAARASDLVRHARAVEILGPPEAALPIHQQNVSAAPLEPNLHRQMGLYLLRMGDDAAASLAFARARSLDFDDTVLKADLDRLGFDDAMSRRLAVPAFFTAPAPKPPSPGLWARLSARRAAKTAKQLRQSGDWANAASAQRLVLRHNPYNATAHVRLGHALKEMGRPGAAEPEYWAGIAVKPDGADAYLQLGHLLREVFDKGVALPAYIAAWKLSPDHREMGEVLGRYGLSPLEAADLVGRFGFLDAKKTADCVRASTDPTTAAQKGGAHSMSGRPRSRFLDVRAAALAGDISRFAGARA